MSQSKSFSISKQLYQAYKRVKANRGTSGVDGVSLSEFEENLEDNLYKLWNRMSSGSYFPPAVRMVEIPKPDGSKRALGIPTVADRIAQMVVKLVFEPKVEPIFHKDSYGYRPRKSAIEAAGVARKRCWQYYWLVDLDIKEFFDNLDHELMMKAVERHTKEKWVRLYVKRWLEAPIEHPDGRREERKKGTPQGGVISPLLANLYLHYAVDMWMVRTHDHIRFERYADDILVHCVSEKQAKYLRDKINERLKECKLTMHPDKTKIVYCKGEYNSGRYDHEKFDFLGYTFQTRAAINKKGEIVNRYNPAISKEALKKINRTIRSWRIHLHTGKELEEIAEYINPAVRGWINYYGAYYKSELNYSMHRLNCYLSKWVFRKYKRFKNRQWAKANDWLGRIAEKNPNLFAHWKVGFRPATG
jgi:RNA-directed DNA polymerase